MYVIASLFDDANLGDDPIGRYSSSVVDTTEAADNVVTSGIVVNIYLFLVL